MKINEILEDISIAAIVLTRVPINSIFSINQNIEIHRGQWAYPIIGALIGFLLFLIIFQKIDQLFLPVESSSTIKSLNASTLFDFFSSWG